MTYNWTEYKRGFVEGTEERLDGLEDRLWKMTGTFNFDHDAYWDGYHDGYMEWQDKTTIRRKGFWQGHILRPKSSLSKIPFLWVDRKIKFGFFCQLRQPFGLYIRLPFIGARWGAA